MQYRKACISDVPQMQKLINGYADEGLMLAKPLVALYENIREYIVAEQDGEIVGVAALHVLWSDLAEVRSLAVSKEIAKQGVGRKLVETLLEEAAQIGLPQVFALTYQTEFFSKMGFVEVERHTLPQKVWMECINCLKFPDCDEHAFIYKLK